MDSIKPMRTPLVTPTEIPVVTSDDISNTDSVLNDTYISGKKAGSVVLSFDDAGNIIPYISQGDATDSTWLAIGSYTDLISQIDDLTQRIAALEEGS